MSSGVLSLSSLRISAKSNALPVIGFAVGLPIGAGMGPLPALVTAEVSSSKYPPHLLESNLFSAKAKLAKNEPMNGSADLTNVKRM